MQKKLLTNPKAILDKILSKLGIIGNIFYLKNITYEQPTANII